MHITMSADTSFFQFQGGIRSNSLCDMLQLNEANENDIQPIIHSPYYDIRLIHEFSRERQPLHCDVIVGKQ